MVKGLKTRPLLVGILIILVLTIFISSIFSFGIFQNKESEENEKSGELFLNVGSKRVPNAAIKTFERYHIKIDLTQEEKEQITSLEDFFIMGRDLPEDIDKLAENPNDYKLSIIGEVENPLTLSYEDIITRFEIKHMVTELYCMPQLTGIGKFSGPSLYDVISYAKPTADNAKIVFIAADGYEKGWYNQFSLTQIKDHREDYLLAVAMNGYPLAIEHGYPARLALTSRSGGLWVKWLVKIAIVPEDATREEYATQLLDDNQDEISISYVMSLSTIKKDWWKKTHFYNPLKDNLL